jgi:hypothetical protein
MARVSNLEKVAQATGGAIDRFSDGSSSWVTIQDNRFVITIDFDGKGNVFTGVTVAQKIWQVVDEKIIAEVSPKNKKRTWKTL